MGEAERPPSGATTPDGAQQESAKEPIGAEEEQAAVSSPEKAGDAKEAVAQAAEWSRDADLGDDFEDEEELVFIDVEEPETTSPPPEPERDEALLAMIEEQRAQIEELQERLEATEQERANTYQRMLRVAADSENLKRRVQREREEMTRFGSEKLLLDILPAIDNLERALAHAPDDADTGLARGVSMVERQLKQALGRHGCESFVSTGKEFDPQKHEAVQQVPTPDAPPNTVVEEYHRGYFLHERLIRPAMVVVARQPDEHEVPTEDELIAVGPTGEASVRRDSNEAVEPEDTLATEDMTAGPADEEHERDARGNGSGDHSERVDG